MLPQTLKVLFKPNVLLLRIITCNISTFHEGHEGIKLCMLKGKDTYCIISFL